MPATILTVDDDEDIRSLVRATLAEFEVLEASDGARGLALACTRRPDLILLDRQMPHLDGLEALRTLAENPATASIPVIILSSLAAVDDRVEGLAAGAFDYISKPFSPPELQARVSGALRQVQRWREVQQPDDDSQDDTTQTRGLQESVPAAENNGPVTPELIESGTVIDSKYEVLGLAGLGGMAVVYRARHLLLDRVVALKLIRSDRAPRPSYQQRFFREARLSSRLQHPNVVSVHDFGRSPEGHLYLVMDLVEGVTLHQLVKAEGPLAPTRAVSLACQLLDGLAAAHELGILHRDIKSTNALVDDGDRLHIMDFGLAKELDPDVDPELTQRGVSIGTPLYMSPEQASGEETDPRTDLYSAGVVLYELLCGRPPFVGGRSPDVMRRHCTEEPAQPSSVGEGIPLVLDPIILRALAKAPEDRWPSATAFRDALLEALAAL